MGGLVIFVDVMRVNIIRIIEVAFREGSGDNTSCGRKVVEQCTNDRKIKDKLIIPCGFSWYVAAGEQINLTGEETDKKYCLRGRPYRRNRDPDLERGERK